MFHSDPLRHEFAENKGKEGKNKRDEYVKAKCKEVLKSDDEQFISNVENEAVIAEVRARVNKTMEKYPLFAY